MSAAKREYNCKINPNKFCYVCAKYIFASPRNFTDKLQTAYSLYFKVTLENRDKGWTPNFLCNSCSTNLTVWMAGGKYG